jgi:hypothetical protein
MNGFAEHRASETSGASRPKVTLMTWENGTAMLPLVRRVVADVLACQQRLAQLQPERARLERARHHLSWPERARRYEIVDEIAFASDELRRTRAELEALGVTLLHAKSGMVGFPTIVNNRPAYFAWLPGEEKLNFWCFADDHQRRPVPEAWTRPIKAAPAKPKSRRRK